MKKVIKEDAGKDTPNTNPTKVEWPASTPVAEEISVAYERGHHDGLVDAGTGYKKGMADALMIFSLGVLLGVFVIRLTWID